MTRPQGSLTSGIGEVTLVGMQTAVSTAGLLLAAYDRYDAASAAHAGDDEPALIEARYELALALVADGWQPPPAVVEQMERDRAALGIPRVIHL